MRTALLIDERFRDHHNPPDMPEREERIDVLLPLAKDPGREGVIRVEPRPATREEILAAHSESHYDRIAETAGQDQVTFDWDTFASPLSFETALLAAGGLLEVVDAVMSGAADNGLALVRPPGHHAEINRAMGFCLFNNVAVAAAHLKRQAGIERVAIVDWDVHHGNGTQDVFYADPNVLFISLHQHPLYPGTGMVIETGAGEGDGYTVNVPLPAGKGDADYVQAFEQIVAPALREFDPDFVLVSAGFDTDGRDPLGGMNMTAAGFAALTRILMNVAKDRCGGRLAAVLEGGYSLEALEEGVGAVLRELGNEGGTS